MLGGARKAGVERVDVHLDRFGTSQQTMVRWKKWTLSR